MLYLTPSGLDGKLAEQFYVTGANAGIYVAVGDSKQALAGASNSEFVQYDPQEGEPLPSQISSEDARKASTTE